jgi:hypothetical protein
MDLIQSLEKGAESDEQENQLEGTLLSELLEDKDDVFKLRILNLVTRHGLDKNDPLFHFLITTDYLQVMLEEAPVALEQSFEKQKKLLDKAVKESTARAIASQNSNIREAVKDIIRKTDGLQLKNPKLLTVAGLLFLMIFLLGSASGVAITLGLRQLQSSGLKIATKEEALDLAWAQSEEGRFARNLYQWNKNYIESGRCQQDLKEQGVSLRLGNNEIKEGICALFVQPPPN